MDAAASIRRTVLQALARDRTPGWSFTGFFQGLEWPVIGTDSMTVTMPRGPHCTDAEGKVDRAALLVLFDAALVSPLRIALEPGARMATTHINVQFTGVAAHGDVSVDSRMQGATHGGALRQLLAHATLVSAGQTVLVGNGAFVQLPPPGDATSMAPLPWQRSAPINPPPLTQDQCDARERAVFAACEAALAASAADPRFTFLQRFWGIMPERTSEGAQCIVNVGPQLANRVGHVQGGILMGIAAETAALAVPQHPLMANLSAWFTGPGRGGTLLTKSWAVHVGRSLAVVHTQITTPEGARVLEATSAHAA